MLGPGSHDSNYRTCSTIVQTTSNQTPALIVDIWGISKEPKLDQGVTTRVMHNVSTVNVLNGSGMACC